MPKQVQPLSALAVKKLSRPGLHAVGGVPGLLIRVAPSGAKYWVLRARVGGHRRDIGLGGYPELSLAKARERAGELRERIRNGEDPVAERKAAQEALKAANAKRITFDEAAAQYLSAKESEFSNRKHAQQWRNTLATYASPVFGDLWVDSIELAHIMRALEPHWTAKPETMKRLRGRIEAVLNWATVRGYRKGENPARWKGNLDALLPSPSKVQDSQHFKALPIDEMPPFMAQLRERREIAARALEFTILTAARSGEVRNATWDEIDLGQRVWTIPAHRMKGNRQHRVPLSDAAMDLLENLPRLNETKLLFPSNRGRALSDMTLTKLLRRMDVDATVHGFRSTFRDWAAERTSYPEIVPEMALAHTIESKVERAYRRGDLFEKRRNLMDDWENSFFRFYVNKNRLFPTHKSKNARLEGIVIGLVSALLLLRPRHRGERIIANLH